MSNSLYVMESAALRAHNGRAGVSQGVDCSSVSCDVHARRTLTIRLSTGPE